MDYDRILPGLFVGAHPSSGDDIDLLKQESGITAVLNLQTDDDMQAWRRHWPTLAAHYQKQDIEVRRVPITDFDSISLGQRLPDGVEALNQLRRAGHTVYVHCTAGVWRAPTVVIAYMHWCVGWELEEAIAHVKHQRPCSPSLEALRLATLQFFMNPSVRHKVRGEGDDGIR